jgi:hypothetical protein
VTAAQILSFATTIMLTLLYAPGLWRQDRYLTPVNILLWSASIILCVLSFVGVR